MAIPPTPRKNKPEGPPAILDENTFRLICERLAESGSKYKCCMDLGLNYVTVQQEMKKQQANGDDSWLQLWEDSYNQFRDTLEQEAIRRSRDGVTTPVFGKEGQIGEVQEYDSRLMELMLKGHFPERYRDKISPSGELGMEPIDAFGTLSIKAKKLIRDIIMRDLEEQRMAAEALRQQDTLDGQFTVIDAIEDLRSKDAGGSGVA